MAMDTNCKDDLSMSGVSFIPLARRFLMRSLRRLHSSNFLLIFVITFVLAATYHITRQPYPNNWDDAWYAISTCQWLSFIEQRGLWRGIFWGLIYILPPHVPPPVFVTSLVGGLFNGTLAASSIIIVQILCWWNQCFGPVSPSGLAIFPPKSFMRPIDIASLPAVLDTLATYLTDESKATIWVVGESSPFNPPLVFALAIERGYQWVAQRVYSWRDPDQLEPILERLAQGEWVVLHEAITDRSDLFTNFEFDDPLVRYDNAILEWVQNHPDIFTQIARLESTTANNRIWIYKITRSTT
jgi:hypothetical protein